MTKKRLIRLEGFACRSVTGCCCEISIFYLIPELTELSLFKRSRLPTRTCIEKRSFFYTGGSCENIFSLKKNGFPSANGSKSICSRAPRERQRKSRADRKTFQRKQPHHSRSGCRPAHTHGRPRAAKRSAVAKQVRKRGEDLTLFLFSKRQLHMCR